MNILSLFVPFCPVPFGLSWWQGDKKGREAPPQYINAPIKYFLGVDLTDIKTDGKWSEIIKYIYKEFSDNIQQFSCYNFITEVGFFANINLKHIHINRKIKENEAVKVNEQMILNLYGKTLSEDRKEVFTLGPDFPLLLTLPKLIREMMISISGVVKCNGPITSVRQLWLVLLMIIKMLKLPSFLLQAGKLPRVQVRLLSLTRTNSKRVENNCSC